MSVQASAWAIQVKGLPIATKAILMILAERHNLETGQCNPSIRWLQDITGLKERALQMHLKALEEANLLAREYTHHGRGKGCSVSQYNIKIGILGVSKNNKDNPKDIAPAKSCARKNTSMRPQNLAGPYRDLSITTNYSAIEPEREPEKVENRKPLGADAPSFEEAWSLYQASTSKAGQTKKQAKAQWPKAVNRAGGADRLLKAIALAVEAQRQPGKFTASLPDMFRWLRDDRWQDAERDLAPEPPAEITTEKWKSLMRGFVDDSVWPAYAGPKPSEPGCRAPEAMLAHYHRIQAVGKAA